MSVHARALKSSLRSVETSQQQVKATINRILARPPPLPRNSVAEYPNADSLLSGSSPSLASFQFHATRPPNHNRTENPEMSTRKRLRDGTEPDDGQPLHNINIIANININNTISINLA